MKRKMGFLIGPSGLILLGAILSAIGALWASQSRGLFEQQLKEKNEEIASLNKEIVNIVTGGDSYCLFDFTGTIHNPFVMRHVGKYPIYELKIIIRDFKDYRNLSGLSVNIITAPTFSLDAGTIRPQHWGLMPTLVLDTKLGAQGFQIQFESRGGTWIQEFRFIFAADKIEYATKVSRYVGEKNEIIYSKASDEFPKNKNGEIVWYQNQ